MAEDSPPEGEEKSKEKSSPEWTETCIGVWLKTGKENNGKNEEERRVCRGISILHLNKFANLKKVKNIPTQGIEIVITESAKDKPKPRNIHPFLGIFVDEQDAGTKETTKIDNTSTENNLKAKGEEKNASGSQTDEATPRILHKVAENWSIRATNARERMKKYYNDPKSSAEIVDEVKETFSNGYETTLRILSYCQPRQKLSQVYGFVTERAKSVLKWWRD